MSYIYVLTVLLAIFEGIIIQCEGGCTFSLNTRQDAPLNEINRDQLLPNDVIELIVSKTDFETINEAIQSFIVPPNAIVMSRILEDGNIVLMPHCNKKVFASIFGDMVIGSYAALSSFFEKFGPQVKNITINIGEYYDPCKEITQNIIKKFAKIFVELQIEGFYQDSFWNEISDGENDIIFPNVKKFQMKGNCSRNNFKLNSIFPKLERFGLDGKLGDKNCLDNVNGLKELILHTDSIKEDKLDGIFANNKNLLGIGLTKLIRTETMHSIAKHLTKLKTLMVSCPGENFLLRANNSQVCKLPSVIHFGFSFYQLGEAFGNERLSFDMPHLKELTLDGFEADDRIIDFIQSFKELENLNLFLADNGAVKYFEKLKNIKEFTTSFHANVINDLKNMFTNFDKNSKMETIKFGNCDKSLYETYEDTMNQFNIDLKNSMKPTWTMSQEKQIEMGCMYLVFKREPCTCKSCEE